MSILTILISALTIICFPTNNQVLSANGSSIEISAEQRNVVFRGTQKLRSNDGREIRFYSNGTCEMYSGDRLEFTCRYKLQDGELHLLDERGNTVSKGTYRLKSSGTVGLSYVTIQGRAYRAIVSR